MSEPARITYRGSELEALYGKIFRLQRDAGWQPQREYAVWRSGRGWSDHRSRDLDMPAAASNGLGERHAVCEAKIAGFREAMQAGRWSAAHPNPVLVMADGELSDGHHRLAAASEVDWATVSNDPEFVVIFTSDLIPD